MNRAERFKRDKKIYNDRQKIPQPTFEALAEKHGLSVDGVRKAYVRYEKFLAQVGAK